jgi:hypothetical protein
VILEGANVLDPTGNTGNQCFRLPRVNRAGQAEGPVCDGHLDLISWHGGVGLQRLLHVLANLGICQGRISLEKGFIKGQGLPSR